MPLTVNIERLWDQKYRDASVPFPIDGTGSGTVTESDVTNLVGDLAAKAPLASPALTGNPTAPTQSPLNNSTRVATTAYVDAAVTAGGGGGGTDAQAVHYLVYDTTGVSGASAALQTAIDAGHRSIFIPPGVFKCDAAIFDDLVTNDANATLYINAYGVRFEATSSLPTASHFETDICTGNGFPTGCVWFFFPNTKRSALSGGLVTTTGNFVTPTYQSRVPVSPRLVMRGATFSAINLTLYNGGFVFGNRGGAFKLEDCHLSSARTLCSWDDYVDGNSMWSCSGWGATPMDATYDAWLWFGGGSGDGVSIDNVKTDNYIGTARMSFANGAHIRSTVGGAFEFRNCKGVTIENHHVEQDADIGNTLRRGFYIQNSDVIIDGGFDYTTDSLATTGLVYLDDTPSTEGASSHVELRNFHPRDWITTTDPSGGWAIYINKMANASRIRCRSCYQMISTTGTFFFAYGRSGLKITGNASNESTLATGLSSATDLIGSGDFDIVKSTKSTLASAQNSAANIVVRGIGNAAQLYCSYSRGIPTFYDSEVSFNGTGTLTNGTAYNYCAAICNTLPDGSIQYGQSNASAFVVTPNAGQVAGFELYCSNAESGATIVIWRKAGSSVFTAPTAYVVIPINALTTRFLDTGVNINKWPWITTSIPAAGTVAAADHTLDGLYVAGTAITVP